MVTPIFSDPTKYERANPSISNQVLRPYVQENKRIVAEFEQRVHVHRVVVGRARVATDRVIRQGLWSYEAIPIEIQKELGIVNDEGFKVHRIAPQILHFPHLFRTDEYCPHCGYIVWSGLHAHFVHVPFGGVTRRYKGRFSDAFGHLKSIIGDQEEKLDLLNERIEFLEQWTSDCNERLGVDGYDAYWSHMKTKKEP